MNYFLLVTKYKCIWNNLMNYKFQFGKYTAQWQDIVEFFNKDKKQPIRAAPKIAKKNIYDQTTFAR